MNPVCAAIKTIPVLLLSLTFAAHATGFFPTFVAASSGGGASATPALIFNYATVVNPVASGQSGSNYKVFIPPTGSGDTVVLAITYLRTQTITVTDSASDASPTAICTADAGTGNTKTSIYDIVPTSGTTWFNFASATNFTPFDVHVSEFNNISSTTAQGYNCQANLASTAGTVTPNASASWTSALVNNNGTGGNLIYDYKALATGSTPSCNASGYTPGTSYTLLNGDTSSWFNGNGYGYQHATQYQVQTTFASTTPSMAMAGETCSGGNGDAFNSATIALKIGTAGITAPSTIHIANILTYDNQVFGSPNTGTSYTFPTPTTGNTRVWMAASTSNTGSQQAPADATSVTSSDSCNYTHYGAGGDGLNTGQPGLWVATNCSPCPTCVTTFTWSSSKALWPGEAQFYDIQNGAASSYKGFADNSGGVACSGTTSGTNIPSFTPTGANGITIALMANGNGPTTGVTAPSGSYYTCPVYTNQTDSDYMCSGNGHAIYPHASAAAQSWAWSKVTGLTTCDGLAAEFE